MNKLLNYKTKTKNATPPIFTEIVALFFFTNCQRWDYSIRMEMVQKTESIILSVSFNTPNVTHNICIYFLSTNIFI